MSNNITLSTLDLSTLVPGSGSTGTDSEQALASQLRLACETDGFFYLINHGVDADLIASTFSQSKHFFQLPTDQKRASIAVKSRGNLVTLADFE